MHHPISETMSDFLQTCVDNGMPLPIYLISIAANDTAVIVKFSVDRGAETLCSHGSDHQLPMLWIAIGADRQYAGTVVGDEIIQPVH